MLANASAFDKNKFPYTGDLIELSQRRYYTFFEGSVTLFDSKGRAVFFNKMRTHLLLRGLYSVENDVVELKTVSLRS